MGELNTGTGALKVEVDKHIELRNSYENLNCLVGILDELYDRRRMRPERHSRTWLTMYIATTYGSRCLGVSLRPIA